MVFHSHGEALFEATRNFTDREEPLALFEKSFAEAQDQNQHRVICWHGVGGQGKSRLHDEIRRRITGNPDVALAGLDFDVPRHRRLEDAMLKLRGDLSRPGMSFPTFDLAFARHFALERPGENIREVHPQLYRKGESQIVDDMIDWSEAAVDAAVAGASLAVPGLNILYKYGARLTGRLGDWWASRAVKGKLTGLDQLSPSALADRLPQYLGFDIWRARAEIGCPRIVITIDTHEKLSGGELRGDAWLQSLVRETPGALILIFGRDELRWAELNERWSDVLDQHLLGALSDEDADSFLARVPIHEAEIRERIVGAADGLPHYLDLAVSTYEDIVNTGGTPSLADFGTTTAEVRERFLDHLSESERRELFVASYPESLSARLFLDLADVFLGGAGNVNWARMCHRSFMTRDSEGRLVMHALMREALQNQEKAERAELFARVHEYLFERYAERARVPDAISVTPRAEQAFLSAAFHAGHLGRERLLSWTKCAHKPFQDAARWELLERIYDTTLSQYPEGNAERAWLLHELALVRQAMGRNADAELVYEKALAIKKTARGESHPDYAETLRELALVRRAMGRHAEAERLCDEALEIYKVALGEAHPDYAATLYEMAGVCQAMGRHAEAEGFCKQALLICKSALGETHPFYAATLHELARIYGEIGRYAEAESFYRQSLGIYRTALGEVHPYYATNLHNLAYVLQAMGRHSEAAEGYEEALRIKAATLSEVHPDYVATLRELAHIRLATGRPAEADPLFKQLFEIDRASLGEAHPQTILTLANLAQCLACSGKIEGGWKAIGQALERSAELAEGAELWTGRVRLKWAQGLFAAGKAEVARVEAEAARDILMQTLGAEADLTRAAQELVDKIGRMAWSQSESGLEP